MTDFRLKNSLKPSTRTILSSFSGSKGTMTKTVEIEELTTTQMKRGVASFLISALQIRPSFLKLIMGRELSFPTRFQ